jgi:hypothetical protein
VDADGSQPPHFFLQEDDPALSASTDMKRDGDGFKLGTVRIDERASNATRHSRSDAKVCDTAFSSIGTGWNSADAVRHHLQFMAMQSDKR